MAIDSLQWSLQILKGIHLNASFVCSNNDIRYFVRICFYQAYRIEAERLFCTVSNDCMGFNVVILSEYSKATALFLLPSHR